MPALNPYRGEWSKKFRTSREPGYIPFSLSSRGRQAPLIPRSLLDSSLCYTTAQASEHEWIATIEPQTPRGQSRWCS
jgi:hypothetical protein